MSDTSKGLFLPPLFDRLNPDGPVLLTEEQVKESIKHEISLMLNTRCAVSRQEDPIVFGVAAGVDDDAEHGGGARVEALNCVLPELLGLMDFSSFKGEDSSNWPTLARYLEQCITSFEPRLRQPHVKILRFNPTKQEISLTLSGNVSFGKRVEHLVFPLSVTFEAPR